MVAFKWRHWGKMTGKLVCPIGPDTKLEADPTNQQVEIFGVCICHIEADFKIQKVEVRLFPLLPLPRSGMKDPLEHGAISRMFC